MNCLKKFFKISMLAFFFFSMNLLAETPLSDEDCKKIIYTLETSKLTEKQSLEISEAARLSGVKRRLAFKDNNANKKLPKKIANEVKDFLEPSPVKTPKLGYVPGKFEISPVKFIKDGGLGYQVRHYAIYAMVAIKNNDISYIPSQQDRINFDNILGDNVKINDKNLKIALLEMEIKIRSWIKKNPMLYFRTLYVGLADNMTKRVNGHGGELKALPTLDDGYTLSRWSPNRKARFIASVWDLGFNVRMSGLVYNIDNEYLEILEVLIGLQFNVLAKGNTLLGNKDAWEYVNNYMNSTERKEKLGKLDLLNTVENLDDVWLKKTINL